MDSKAMPIKLTKIGNIKLNENNPRFIKDFKYKRLLKSITEFPEMLMLRPIVVDSDMVIIGGNQRYKACVEAGLKEVPVIIASELTPEQLDRFILTDNVSFGDWDYDLLSSNWSEEVIDAAGMDLWKIPDDVDYGVLDEDDDQDIDGQVDEMKEGVRKAIMIEFELEYYEDAVEVVKFWRERKANVGMMVLEFLKAERAKL